MKARDFMRQLERTFGEYLPGMREGVIAYLQRIDERLFDGLYRKLLKEHEDHWPPSVARLHRFLRELSNLPPRVGLLPAPPMCKEERSAGLQKLLKDLAEAKKMPKPASERSDRERR